MEISEQITKLIEHANMIKKWHEEDQQLKEELLKHKRRLRPSVGGISLVSCLPETPQLGFSNVTAESIRNKLDKPLDPPGRRTPEKHLQSWIFREALSADGEVTSLSKLLGGTFWVVSDEIAISLSATKPREKLVADMLLVREDTEGRAAFVNVELKYRRSNDTFEQVEEFRILLEQSYQCKWQKFAEIMMPDKRFKWQQSSETRGLVIWLSDRPSSGAKLKMCERVDVIGARRDAHDYTLKFEHST